MLIIAILIAIAIPIFTQQLARANAATDAANIRSGYAQVQSDIILDNITRGEAVLLQDGTVSWSYQDSDAPEGGTATPSNAYRTKGNKRDLDTDVSIGGVQNVTWTSGNIVTYTVAGGKISQINGGSE